VLTNEQLSAFALEIATFGNIPISSRDCGIGCIYCKVNEDPVLCRYPKIPDISLEDLYLGFSFVNPSVNYVRLGAGVLVAPHSDPYLHPLIYDFIKHTSDYFKTKKVTTVTTGSYIEEDKLDYLNGISNFAVDLSLVTMQSEREYIIPRSTRERIYHLLKYAPLNKVTLMFTGDIDSLRKDLDLLRNLGVDQRANEILVRRIEHTKYSHLGLNSISDRSINGYEECVGYLRVLHPEVVYTVPYLTDAFRGGSNEYFIEADQRIKMLTARMKLEANESYDLICSESSYQYFSAVFQGNTSVNIHLVRNELYGGSTTVAGLLNIPDICSQVHPGDVKGTLVLPFEMYNCKQCDILGNHISAIQNHYKQKVWMA